MSGRSGVGHLPCRRFVPRFRFKPSVIRFSHPGLKPTAIGLPCNRPEVSRRPVVRTDNSRLPGTAPPGCDLNGVWYKSGPWLDNQGPKLHTERTKKHRSLSKLQCLSGRLDEEESEYGNTHIGRKTWKHRSRTPGQPGASRPRGCTALGCTVGPFRGC